MDGSLEFRRVLFRSQGARRGRRGRAGAPARGYRRPEGYLPGRPHRAEQEHRPRPAGLPGAAAAPAGVARADRASRVRVPVPDRQIGRRRVGKACRWTGHWSSDVCSSDLKAHDEDAEAGLAHLREVIGDRKVISRVDRTELSKNIVRGLLAYRELLRLRPEWHGRIVQVAYAYPSRTDRSEGAV